MPVIGDYVALMVDRIILATDLTPVSETATGYARAIAKRFSSNLTLAHIVDLSASISSEKAVLGIPRDDMRRISSLRMEGLLRELSDAGIRATAHALEAHNPAAAIVGLAHQLNADLIVAGTHSRHGLSKAILGSCAEGIIRHATCPVMTTGPKAKLPANGAFSFHTILFATNFESDAAAKASVAFAFAQDSAAKIYLCHILEHAGKDVSQTLEMQLNVDSALQKIIPQSSYDWCDPHCITEQGKAADHIIALANRVKADLIVLGAKRSFSWFAHLNNGLVGNVLAQAECPVMTICSM
jgi:nucleotide-binding universal stress UspA family protein